MAGKQNDHNDLGDISLGLLHKERGILVRRYGPNDMFITNLGTEFLLSCSSPKYRRRLDW